MGIENVSFTIPVGSSMALVGATGSGKAPSSICCSAFMMCRKGSLLIDGMNVRDYDLNQLRSQMGLVLQDIFLFSGNIAGNISLNARRFMKRRSYVRHRQCRLINLFSVCRENIRQSLKERGSTFSPTAAAVIFRTGAGNQSENSGAGRSHSSVDTETELLIQEALVTVMKDRTSVVVAHRLSTIKKMDTILVMHKGEIVERGTHQDLLQQEGMYWRLYQLQYKDQFDLEDEQVVS